MKKSVEETRILMENLSKFLQNTEKMQYTPCKVILESKGYNTIDEFISDGFSGKLQINEFNSIIDKYLYTLNEGAADSAINTVLQLLTSAGKFIKKTAIKSLSAIASFIKKILGFIVKFKKEHPVIFWAIVAILIMIINTALSASAEASVIQSHPVTTATGELSARMQPTRTLDATQINQLIGSIQDIVNAAPDGASDVAFDLGKYQAELVKARDNANYIIDLNDNGFFEKMTDYAQQYIRNTKDSMGADGSSELVKPFIDRLISIGKTFIISK